MRTSIILGILMSFLACSAPSTAQKKGKLPTWIEQPYKQYDKSQYLLAVGSGSDAQAAQNNALMNLSRIFQADIDADQRLFDEIREISKNGKLTSVDEASSLINNVRIGTKQDIKNSKILETYTDKVGQVTVLAGIERKPTAQLYQAEIEKNESQIVELELKSNEETNPVRKLARLQEAFVLAKLNNRLATQREIILERPGSGLELESYKRVKESVEKQKRATKVVISGDNLSDEMRAAITESFQKEGFEVTNDRTDAALEAQTTFFREAIDLGRDDAQFVKWTLSINVMDLQENRSFLTWQEESRDGSKTQKEAFLRAEFNAKRKVSRSFGKKLNNQFLAY
jgi:hypothetical protein